jgi:hypothetical protein
MSQHRFSGRNATAVAATVVVCLAAFVILESRTRTEREQHGRCAGNLQRIGSSMFLYLSDNDDRFPPGPWQPAISLPKSLRAEELGCPKSPPGTGYAMSVWLVGRRLSEVADPNAEEMFFETSELAPSLARSPATTVHAARHAGKTMILYASGRIISRDPKTGVIETIK